MASPKSRNRKMSLQVRDAISSFSIGHKECQRVYTAADRTVRVKRGGDGFQRFCERQRKADELECRKCTAWVCGLPANVIEVEF